MNNYITEGVDKIIIQTILVTMKEVREALHLFKKVVTGHPKTTKRTRTIKMVIVPLKMDKKR